MRPGWGGDTAVMDEATIDCAICGTNGVLEVQLQGLNDSAEWRTVTTWVVCSPHIRTVRIDPLGLAQHQRLVLMPLL